ncbi:hypothetical protein M404DRAFT_27249 [Pisolithus tinctorius Marx 270]|uniref:Uncharacterized protein n=1 Tax=Pisolithus tinctorius Marx 270 TaxID=870435 RepID=A0A0C3P787_PISTI|nr:hypothetical protein M404DRAFT_27249 [Pisolithus tinctorius Marx 270]
MSANCAPRLSQLIHALTPDPTEAEKAALREQIVAVSAGLIAEAKCVPDDREDMWEEKMIWLRRWEEKMMLGVSMWVDAADAPVLAEADDVYKWWTVEEAEARAKAEQDVQMGEETAEGVGDEGTGVKMSHVEVPQPAHKHLRQTIAESENEAGPRVTIPPGSVLHKVPCARCSVKNMGCEKEKSTKATGKQVQAGASIVQSSKAPKAGPSKRAHDDDDDDIMEVVKSRTRRKGKTSGCSMVSNKTTTDLSQALAMVRAEAVAAHAANLRLQVHIEQLAEVLAEHGIK